MTGFIAEPWVQIISHDLCHALEELKGSNNFAVAESLINQLPESLQNIEV